MVKYQQSKEENVLCPLCPWLCVLTFEIPRQIERQRGLKREPGNKIGGGRGWDFGLVFLVWQNLENDKFNTRPSNRQRSSGFHCLGIPSWHRFQTILIGNGRNLKKGQIQWSVFFGTLVMPTFIHLERLKTEISKIMQCFSDMYIFWWDLVFSWKRLETLCRQGIKMTERHYSLITQSYNDD